MCRLSGVVGDEAHDEAEYEDEGEHFWGTRDCVVELLDKTESQGGVALCVRRSSNCRPEGNVPSQQGGLRVRD